VLTNNRRVRQLFTRNNPLKPSLYPNTTPLQYRTALQGRAQRFFLPRDAMLSRYMLSSCVPPSARLSVCPSVTSRYCIETTGRIGLVLARRLPSTYTTLCYKEIWVSPKIRVLPSRTLSQIPDVENFATASRSRRQQNSSSSSSTVEFVDDTYTTVDESWLFTTRRSTVTL